ncbi:glutamate/Leucine/Phenylalanine/Valine dehydrogenase [Hirsutella rhossiliensis]|uniref:Glutamate dehydrogenase n=1 Tax=Hirsutella rhossiliensis TaxID=111463 RepID=A0A9P8N190_9HYPO|nr:glutamate/Leucine/Phenylalanine/Valine dehydrogenase domain-containing protein [Hirsutella rhossiliensis]KAH0965035.1 glutamate/Leucine/Phenylalanine/Valine dehydrogenase domain-containing protein [Hirsutella rhossiliensis]
MSNLPSEPEFEQAYTELASTLADSTLFQEHPEYRTALEVCSIPERVVQFRVTWEDDDGRLRVNRGYRVQFNSALGPYKGGLRLHPSVNLSILKFLGFEQIFKNALTGLSMGGAKGGADFDPKGKSDAEIRRFCQAFMRELSKHIGADTDVPAGDIGVSGREIGYMFGAYRQARGRWEGVLTGKGLSWGGSLIRPEATGYGVVYYVEHMLEYAGRGGFAGKRVAISGSGNVAQYAALKVLELGATVVSLSDSQGALVATDDGKTFTAEHVHQVAALKARRRALAELDHGGRYTYVAGNEVSRDEAEALTAGGLLVVAEGSNMGCTQEAIDLFEEQRRQRGSEAVWYAPGKAANCGGVAVSGLEMAQNSQRLAWTADEVDDKLKGIMKNAFAAGLETAKKYVQAGEGELPSLVAGSNIAGFVKVAQAMYDQGDWWA